MNDYLVRIILHKAPNFDHPNYVTLHKALQAEQFSENVMALDENLNPAFYKLPKGTYFASNSKSPVQFKDAIKRLVDTIDKDNSIIVTGVVSYSFAIAGLEKVQ